MHVDLIEIVKINTCTRKVCLKKSEQVTTCKPLIRPYVKNKITQPCDHVAK